MAVDVFLVYPYFNEENDRSIFRYPPLGLGYLASMLRGNGISVQLLDCTFITPMRALAIIRKAQPRIVGIYSMVTINHHATKLARELRTDAELLVAGGPLPSIVPEELLDVFDVVVRHEGEHTFLELVRNHLDGKSWHDVQGIAYLDKEGKCHATPDRPFEQHLDDLPFPARDLFPNKSYQHFWKTQHGYTVTSQITTRGCPYLCDFCSNPIFGRSYRERSALNVVKEMREIEKLGYDRVFFSDDCFTQNLTRVKEICNILVKEKLDLEWMCLSRADRLDEDTAKMMAKAGCAQIFFGIESGNERMLKVMNKRIVLTDVERAIRSAKSAGISTGGFFILGYPGESDASLIETLRFSSSLSLDYLSYSFPYPIIGTGLYTKVRQRITRPEWIKQRGKASRHQLLFSGNFSETKLRFAKYKGLAQHLLRRNGAVGIAAAHVIEEITDPIIPLLR
ncbi:MAG: B12-binding domain-containing radical SAM protein [Candidatus Thorarchaeota archaeon]